MNVGINHYLETICNPGGRFRTLKEIGFHLNARGTPEFQAGSRSVIFKITASGEEFAMKCYIKPDENRRLHQQAAARYFNKLNHPGLPAFQYLDQEMYVFDDSGKGAYYPVTLTRWVEGNSLRSWLIENCRTQNGEALWDMAEKFRELALYLLEQPWAHGDLKPDNIVVSPEGTLHLIDFDNVFIPEFTGLNSPELGTPGYQHPLRNAGFHRDLDDYSIALISTALYTLCSFPEWYMEQKEEELLLFNPENAVSGHCEKLQTIKEYWMEKGRTDLYRLSTLLHSPSADIGELSGILRKISPLKEDSELKTTEQAPEIYRENGLYGYRTTEGIPLTEPVYEDAQEFREGLAAVRIGKRKYYIGTDGKKRIDASVYGQTGDFSEGLAAVQKGKKWGYIDKSGQTVIPPQFEKARCFREQMAAVRQDGKWGYIDPSGTFTIAPAYDQAFDFREQIAVAGVHGRFGYIDPTGKWLTAPCFSFASGFRNGRAAAESEGKTYRLIYRRGRITAEEITT